MTKKVALILSLTFVFTYSFSQQIIYRDPDIKKMVDEISSKRIEKDILKLVSFHTRHNLSEQNNPKQGIGAAWNWIKAEMEKSIPQSNGRLTVEFDRYTIGGEGQRIDHEVELRNVIATLKGTNPDDDRILLVSAHLDSRAGRGSDSISFAPGANDDGSGIAAILEMVRIMSKKEFSGTIKFMAVSGEEHGLYGAGHVAETAKKENWNIVAMLNNDMIGNSGSSGTLLNDNMKVRVFSEGVPQYETEQMARMRRYTAAENDGKARQLARYIKEVGERYVDQLSVTLIYRNDRFGRGGDHTPFCKKGFTAVRLTEFNENYDRTHKDTITMDGIRYGDLPFGVDYEYVRKNAGINLATLANLASAPNQPENVGISIRGLSNSTKLSWSAPTKGIKPAGYYVLIRETYQPHWERKIFVTETETELPLSKDNYFFAVQSVDDNGH
ncbi:MAG: M28 family metallopeptidase, partial [Draconibacterium sp.]|nr:M28 family metallopeptidase [Draconibacterium sp.]